jgi:hypothetical protein
VDQVAVNERISSPRLPEGMQVRESDFRVLESSDIERKTALVLRMLGRPMDVGIAGGSRLQKAFLSGTRAPGRSNHSPSIDALSSSHQSASPRTEARIQTE